MTTLTLILTIYPSAIFDEKTRPSWGIFQRVADGLETSLFKEKFQAWPDSNTANVLKPINTCAPKDVSNLLRILIYQ